LFVVWYCHLFLVRLQLLGVGCSLGYTTLSS
jgi:hypothetical protein